MFFCLDKKSTILFFIIGMFSLTSVSFAIELKKETDKKNLRLILPKVIYAAPGIETNVYFDNVFLALNPSNYIFEVTCSKGALQKERWTFTPQNTDVGDHPFELKIRDSSNKVVAAGKSVLRVAKPDAGGGKELSLLLIGDSLTHHSIYPQQLLDNCKGNKNPKIKLIGSHHPEDSKTPENVHEGYGGWTAKRFVNHYTGVYNGDYKKRGSPFLFKNGKNGKLQLDFALYCKKFNDGKSPDIVTIFLGWNDIFGANEDNIDYVLKSMFDNYDKLIEMIRKVSPDTKIGLMIEVPPAATQDAFSWNIANHRWKCRQNQHRQVEKMMQRYGGREKEGIYLIPTHINIDCVNNFPSESVAVNARNPKKIIRQNNSVHPASSGYKQIGDSLYCWLKSNI